MLLWITLLRSLPRRGLADSILPARNRRFGTIDIVKGLFARTGTWPGRSVFAFSGFSTSSVMSAPPAAPELWVATIPEHRESETASSAKRSPDRWNRERPGCLAVGVESADCSRRVLHSCGNHCG